MVHLLMCSSFIGKVAHTGLYLVVLLYASLCSVVLQDVWPRWLIFSSIAGRLAQACLCSVLLQDGWPRLACVQKYCWTAGLGCPVFGSIAGWLAQAGLCSVVLQDGWPRLACVWQYCRTAGLGWLVFSNIAGRLAQAGLYSVVLQDDWPSVRGGVAGTALAGPLFMAIRPHPQLNFCGLGLERTLSFVRVFTFYQNKSILLENNGSQ